MKSADSISLPRRGKYIKNEIKTKNELTNTQQQIQQILSKTQ